LAERLLAEIRRSLEYYTSQEDGVPVTKMFITGGGARLNGLKEFLAARLNLEVVELEALGNAKTPTALDDAGVYQAGYGLALRLLNPTQITVNLLPSDLLARLSEGTKAVWTKYAAILAALLLLEGVGWCWLTYSGRKTQFETLTAEFEGEVRLPNGQPILINGRPVLNKEVLEKMAEIQKRRDQLDERFKTIHDLEVTKYDWIAVLEGIRRVVPENAWITDGRFDFNPNGTTLNMKTTVEDNPRVMLKNIQTSEFLEFAGTGINVQKAREGSVDVWIWSVPLKYKFRPIGAADEMTGASAAPAESAERGE
jgi:Tfp pilus assembly protein PilN